MTELQAKSNDHEHVAKASKDLVLEKLTEAKMNFKTKQLHQGKHAESETQVPDQSQIPFLQKER